jgi:hypothetical protein
VTGFRRVKTLLGKHLGSAHVAADPPVQHIIGDDLRDALDRDAVLARKLNGLLTALDGVCDAPKLYPDPCQPLGPLSRLCAFLSRNRGRPLLDLTQHFGVTVRGGGLLRALHIAGRHQAPDLSGVAALAYFGAYLSARHHALLETAPRIGHLK